MRRISNQQILINNLLGLQENHRASFLMRAWQPTSTVITERKCNNNSSFLFLFYVIFDGLTISISGLENN